MLIIGLKTINHCGECQASDTKRTIGAGYAEDYFCTLMDNKLILGYVEWNNELLNHGIPNWCPLIPLSDKKKIKEKEKYKYMIGL